MVNFRLAQAAESDIAEILSWSEAQFGRAASARYERLIKAGIEDVVVSPLRPGSTARPELGDGIRSWHLRGSRERARIDGIVRRPRHLIIYGPTAGMILIARLLHDAMELERHLGSISD
jgi:toxin ParE1/3/4